MEIINTSLLSVRKKEESNEWVGSKLLSYRSANLDRGIKKGRSIILKDLFY